MATQYGAIWAPSNIGIFLLRILTGAALIYYQGATQVTKAWNYIWEGGSWPMLDHMLQSYAFPVALTFAILTAICYFFGPVLLALGFLTRFSGAAIFIGLVATLNMGIDHIVSTSMHTQTLAIYLVVSLFFVLHGGGALAMDRLFVRRRPRRAVTEVRDGVYA